MRAWAHFRVVSIRLWELRLRLGLTTADVTKLSEADADGDSMHGDIPPEQDLVSIGRA